MYHNFFIHSSVDNYLGCFHVPAVNSAAVNTGVHVSFSVMVFFFQLGYVFSSGIARLYGSFIPSFYFYFFLI